MHELCKEYRMSTIGTAIRTARKSAKMTQEQLAEAMGISKQAVSAWEKRDVPPSVKHLALLSEMLGADLALLMRLAGYDASVASSMQTSIVSKVQDVPRVDAEGMLKISRDVMETLDLTPEMAGTFIARDDSVHPIVKGSVVLIDKRQTAPRDGGIYAVNLYNEIVLRKVYKNVNSFTLRTTSADWPEISISPDDLDIVGRAVHFSAML